MALPENPELKSLDNIEKCIRRRIVSAILDTLMALKASTMMLRPSNNRIMSASFGRHDGLESFDPCAKSIRRSNYVRKCGRLDGLESFDKDEKSIKQSNSVSTFGRW